MCRVGPLDPVAQPDPALGASASIYVAHPRLHDVNANVLTVEAVEIVAESQGDIFVKLIVKAS